VVRDDALLITLGVRGAAVFLVGAPVADPPRTTIAALALLLVAAAIVVTPRLRRCLRRG
jgi:hypothetical protein